MRAVIDKLLILLFGLALALGDADSDNPVPVLLIVFTALCLQELKPIFSFSYTLFITGTIVPFFIPELLFYLPVLSYPLCAKKRSPLLLLVLLPFLNVLFSAGPSRSFWGTLFLLILSLFLADKERQLVHLTDAFITLRDTDKEEKLSMQEQTQNLLAQQDAGIKIATLQERTRIAREIHDNVGHLLSRSLLQVGAMLTLKKNDESLLLLKESLDDAMQGIRNSVHDLRDDAMDLESSAKQLLSDYSSYQTYFEYDIAPDVPVDITYCFLTVTKEALSNIAKHSNADTIRISMKEYSSLYRLSVADNGTDARIPATSTGMGLDNMQARVTALKGTLRFATHDGFHIFVSIPKDR